MGKKYIIELCEKPMKNENGDDVWRVKGFNTLVFDQNGLDKLEEYKEQPVGHKFEVGDVCYIPGDFENPKLLVIRSTPHAIWYMESNGAVWSRLRGAFESQAAYLYHSDTFENFLKEILHELV